MNEKNKILLCMFLAYFLWSPVLEAQVLNKREVLVIEKEVDLDQMKKVKKSTIKPRVPFDQSPPLEVRDLSQKSEDTQADNTAQDTEDERKLMLSEMEIIQINSSLKSIIDENQKLKVQAQELDRQLKRIRGQRTIEINRMNTIMIERDAYKKQSEEVSAVKERVLEYADQREKEINEREQFLAARIKTLEEQLAAPLKEEIAEKKKLESQPENVTKLAMDESKTEELLIMVDSLKEGIRRVKEDKAKVHYNMGNSYFENRDFIKAMREYKKAIKILPEDAYSHFNLAFISSEFMYDHKTALIHFQAYLNLMPEAEDALLVREKIIEAEFHLKSNFDSSLITDLKRSKSDIYQGQ